MLCKFWNMNLRRKQWTFICLNNSDIFWSFPQLVIRNIAEQILKGIEKLYYTLGTNWFSWVFDCMTTKKSTFWRKKINLCSLRVDRNFQLESFCAFKCSWKNFLEISFQKCLLCVATLHFLRWKFSYMLKMITIGLPLVAFDWIGKLSCLENFRWESFRTKMLASRNQKTKHGISYYNHQRSLHISRC